MATAAINSWSPAHTRAEAWVLRVLPSLTDLAFALPFLLLLLAPEGINSLLGDADTGWHIRTGEWILSHHAVPHQDLFSFTFPGRSWFAWEWGWDVLFGAIHQLSGLAGVLFVNLAILGCISALLFRLVRRSCQNDLLAFAITGVAMAASAVHWLARPHLLSWMFFLILLHVLARAEEGRTKMLLWLPPLLLVWTNMHGSFFVGIAMIVISGIGSALAGRDAKPFWWCAAASSACTFVNPYSWHVHAHILRYLSDPKLMDNIQEFQSVSFHHLPAMYFESLLLSGAAALLWCVQKRRWGAAIGVLLWLHLSLTAVRNVPMCVFVASPVIASMLKDVFRSARDSHWLQRAGGFAELIAEQLRPFERVERLHLVSGVLLVYIGISFAVGSAGFEARFPIKSFPESALGTIRCANASRIFTSDQWGDFLIYRLYPRARVFVDGRSDFYGGEFVDRYLKILGARWDWETDLERFSADMVVVSPDTPVATVLKSAAKWQMLFDDGAVIVFGRRPAVQHLAAMGQSPVQVPAVLSHGHGKLGAVSACKYRTNNERRYI